MAARSDSESDEDSFVTVGTPLTPYEKDAPLKKPVAIQEQKVTDSRGRQRFHGAFTGGFSAGYFNTVGSKEGWTPSTFTSSRQSRADKSSQRPEDFMDEEDLGEYGIAPRLVKTTEHFSAQSAGSKRPLVTDGVIPGEAPLADLVVAARLPVGVRLLRKLGWKDGQGIGPRLKKKLRKKKHTGAEGPKVYGCSLPPAAGDTSSSEDDMTPEDVTFAPKDVAPVSFIPKDDLHGLGYSGITVLRNSEFSDTPGSHTGRRSAKNEVKRKGFRGQAFGVGAMEDDDDDIYSSTSLSNYDTVLGGPETDNLHGWTAPRHAGGGHTSGTHTEAVLEGFKLLSTRLNPKTVYGPPDLPRGFKPYHVFTQQEDSSVKVAAAIPAKFSFGWKNMGASDRREALGEKPEIKSVFDLVNSEDMTKLESAQSLVKKDNQSEKAVITSSATAGEAGSTSAEQIAVTAANTVVTSKSSVTTETPETTTKKPLFKASFNVFKPFAKDAAKQARYEKFLELKKQGKLDALDDLWHGEVTEWEQAREREEFARAAQLYKPMSGLMASRFTRGQQEDDQLTATQPNSRSDNLSDQAKAAKMNMFGKLTRETVEWHPDKVLCKRFNVPNPYPDSTFVGVPKVRRDKFSVFNFLGLPGESTPDEQPKDVQEPVTETPEIRPAKRSVGQRSKPLAILASVDLRVPQPSADKNDQETEKSATVEIAERATDDTAPNTVGKSPDNKEANDGEEERPPIDIFKAIFDDSEAEDSDESAPPEETESETSAQANSVPMEVTPTESPAVDVHMQLETLGDKHVESRHKTALREPTDEEDSDPPDPLQQRLKEESSENISTKDDKTSDFYGPSLPPNLSVTGSGDSAEVYPSKKSKKHKHKEKHKHKKKKKAKHKSHKLKKKKKKKSKNISPSESSANSTDSSDSSDNETAPSDRLLLEKLRSVSGRLSASDFM